MDTDDSNARTQRTSRSRDARDQAAAADRDHQRVDLRLLREHLETDRALPRDHREIVVGMDQRHAARACERYAMRPRIVEGIALEHDLGAEAARALDLHRRCEARHHDRRRNAHALRVIRDALRVVARRDREHAGGAFGRGQLGHLVQRAALLEGRGELVVLEFEEDLAAGHLAERARGKARRV